MNKFKSWILHFIYKNFGSFARKRIERYIVKKENGEYWSLTLRDIYEKHYGIKVGIGTYGCFRAADFPKGSIFGNYCSIAQNTRYLNGNHPIEFVSTHPMFYNKELGFIEEDRIIRSSLEVCNDVWIGYGVIILSKCKKIGNGAVIAAGSVVTRDVEPYTIVAGSPARPIGKRFSNEIIEKLEDTKWFEMPPQKLVLLNEEVKNPEEFLMKLNRNKAENND